LKGISVEEICGKFSTTKSYFKRFESSFITDMHKISSPVNRLIFLLLLFFTWNNGASAQQALVSDPISIRNDYGYELIGRMRDRVLLFRDKYDQFEVQAFDMNMRLSWNKELDDLGRHGIQILMVVGGKNDFSVIFKQRRKGHTLLRLHKYDPGANLIDSMTVKDYGENVFTPPILEVLKSEDRNVVVVYNNADRLLLDAICFRLDKMTVMWDKLIHYEYDFSENGLEGLVVNNNGELFMIAEFNNRKSKIEDHEYRIIHVQSDMDEVIQIPMPEFLTNRVQFVYDNQNQRLVGAGLFSDRNRERSKGTFFIKISTGPEQTFLLNYEPFDDKFISILRQKDVEDDNKGITDADVVQLILRQDGGVLLFSELHHEIQRGASAGRGFWRDGMRMVVDYYYDDLFVVAIQPDGKAQWKTVLHKKQYSQDDEGTFSSFYAMRASDKIHVLFNDEIKYESTCSEYLLSPVGGFDRNSLINTVGQSLRLRFRDALQLNTNECLIPSEFRNKLKLVLLRY
jgi:hypothetical protein